ncbi:MULTISPECIES: PH domain-containing protein [unclassified Streptomyces]|uniref:PH domain-containing protein n=1 Tax=unclassified Streptomyces TaxID=2593676 RepID=UPI0022B629E6|nr:MULTISPECIES: PH domain-containing protein [unclassified Streptomyces]MCZ7415329.1 PH domain-containing protein [Streptomyces sp. WMMC897]MCZ7432252.1 PH domain-containing protein [Streptomyces sp. WMMC1477]
MAGIAERHLAEDEELVHVTRQHWTEMVSEFLLLCLVWLVAGLLLWAVPSGEDWSDGAVYVVLGAAVLASLWWWLIPLLTWRSTLYILTTKRMYKRSGFLTKSGRSIPLVRVNDVSFRANLWQRIMRYGTLTIQSASEQGLMTLRHVPDPEGLKAMIYRQVDEEQRGGTDAFPPPLH